MGRGSAGVEASDLDVGQSAYHASLTAGDPDRPGLRRYSRISLMKNFLHFVSLPKVLVEQDEQDFFFHLHSI